MAKAPRLPQKPVTEAEKKAEARKKSRAAKRREEIKKKAEQHKMKEPAKKQPTGRGRPKTKPKVAFQKKVHDAVASRAEKERIEKANKANAKLESKKPVVGNKGKVKPRPSKIVQDTREAGARQRILSENMKTPAQRTKEARVAQENKDFPNRKKVVEQSKLRAEAAKNEAAKAKPRKADKPLVNDQTPEAKKAARKAMLKKAGSVVKTVARCS